MYIAFYCSTGFALLEDSKLLLHYDNLNSGDTKFYLLGGDNELRVGSHLFIQNTLSYHIAKVRVLKVGTVFCLYDFSCVVVDSTVGKGYIEVLDFMSELNMEPEEFHEYPGFRYPEVMQILRR